MTRRIEFDPVKDRVNRRKHGLSLAEAVDFDWTNALEALTRPDQHGRKRFKAASLYEDYWKAEGRSS